MNTWTNNDIRIAFNYFYLKGVLDSYKVDSGPNSPIYKSAYELLPIIIDWSNGHLIDVYPSGSHAKGTAIKGKTDLDLFISLDHDTFNYHTLEEVFQILTRKLIAHGYKPKKQNVSLGVIHNGLQVDLVPAIKHANNSLDHWLYVNKPGKEKTQTNIFKHIAEVKEHKREDEIRAIKIWAMRHNLDFPSIYLELTVIEALKGCGYNLENNIITVLRYLASSFTKAAVYDPANTNNTISDDLEELDKLLISLQASVSLTRPHWREVIW